MLKGLEVTSTQHQGGVMHLKWYGTSSSKTLLAPRPSWFQDPLGSKTLLAPRPSWLQDPLGSKTLLVPRPSWLQDPLGSKTLLVPRPSWLQDPLGSKTLLVPRPSWLQDPLGSKTLLAPRPFSYASCFFQPGNPLAWAPNCAGLASNRGGPTRAFHALSRVSGRQKRTPGDFEGSSFRALLARRLKTAQKAQKP